MNAYIYQADIYCEDCGKEIRKELFDEGNCPSPVELEQELYDSDDFPKGPYPDGGGEADFPQYCTGCHEPLGNPAINHHYKLIVDLDERGSFRAHVEDEDGCEVFEYVSGNELDTEDGETDLVEDGFMRHLRDADGLETYLKTTLKLISPASTVEYRNPYRKE